MMVEARPMDWKSDYPEQALKESRNAHIESEDRKVARSVVQRRQEESTGASEVGARVRKQYSLL